MVSEKLVPNRKCTAEYKLGATRLGEAFGPAGAAKRLGIAEQNV